MLIFFSCILLALDDPFEDPSSAGAILRSILDVILTWIYTFEAVLKIFVYGFQGYFKDGWNLIDFISLSSSLISFFFEDLNFSYLKGIRCIRVLKLSARFKGLKLVLISLIKARYHILKLIIFALSFFIVIALIPNQYFKGKFYRCVNHGPAHVENKIDCFDFGGDWIRADFHWDNVL